MCKDIKKHADMTIRRTDPQGASRTMDCSRSHLLLYYRMLPGRALLVAGLVRTVQYQSANVEDDDIRANHTSIVLQTGTQITLRNGRGNRFFVLSKGTHVI